jgi:dihydropteroate synthase
MTAASQTPEHIHFVTGRLAEQSLRRQLAELAPRVGFSYSVDVLGITVAALLTTDWIAPRLKVPPVANRIILPGYCQGDLQSLERSVGIPVERGPRDLRRLPEYFGEQARDSSYGEYDIEIIAEINHAPRLTLNDILATAARLRTDGADVIDVGCDPGNTWRGVGECVHALVSEGHRVSIDSMNVVEIAAAAAAGAELVLSVNSTNREAAPDWGIEVVAVPDEPSRLQSLDETIERLAAAGVPLRIDPILEPLGFGFAASLGRYLDVRGRYPDAEMMMGIGNLTELTDADSAPINVLLLGICQELGIRSVLTTQVINWARSSVRECDLARRLVHYAEAQKILPRRIEPGLVMLRDPGVLEPVAAELDELAQLVKDHNYRLFAANEEIHAVTSGQHLHASDPFRLFEMLQAHAPRPIDPSHAFYLGFEMAKALTALTLGKNYRQDESLDWGFLTREESFHRLSRTHQAIGSKPPDNSEGPAE